MNNYEILIKSFLRFNFLQKLLNSIERFYPNTTIRIVDDSPTQDDSRGFPQQHLQEVMGREARFLKFISGKENIHFYKMPFDIGLSAGRNYLLDKCQTKYFVLMEDDFHVTSRTNLSRLERVISSSSDIVIAAGGTIEKRNPWKHGKLRNIGEMRVENGYLIRCKYGKRAPTTTVAGIECTPCRLTQNFFMGNLELFNEYSLRWEEKLKIWLEHGYFFYTLPNKLRIYYVSGVWINHYQVRPSYYKGYTQRDRRSLQKVLEDISGGLKRGEQHRDRVIYN